MSASGHSAGLRDHDDYLFEVAVCPTCCRSSVLRRIFAGGPAAGHTDTQFLQAQCVAADPAGVGTTGTVYGMRLRLRTIGLPAW